MCQCGQGINQIAADNNADRGNNGQAGAMEFAGNFRMVFTHFPKADKVEEEDGKNTGIRQFNNMHQRYETSDNGNRNRTDNGYQVGCMIFGMNLTDSGR